MARVLPGPPSSGGGTIRSTVRSGSLPPRPSSGGKALVAALASGSEEAVWKSFTPTSISTDCCLARTWNEGNGGQCPRAQGTDSSFCFQHARRLPHGRVDRPLPEEMLAKFRKVAPSSCTEKRDRLWLPHSANGAKAPISRSPDPPTQALGSTGALTGRLSHRATATKVAETLVAGDTIRLEDPIECAPTPAVGSRAVPGKSPAPPHAATDPAPSPRPLSPRSEGSVRHAVGEGNIGRRRPASANSRLNGRQGGDDVTHINSDVPPAGKRMISEPAWVSRPAGSPPNGAENLHDWGAQLNGEGMGWKPKTLAPGEHLRHDPILHRIDVYMRTASGGVGPRETAKGDYETNARKAALAPRSPGRRKGVSEFEDLCALNAAHWDPCHEAALEHNRLAFHRRDGEFAEMYNNAARYPNKPRPFEPKMMKPAGVGGGIGCARLPPKRVSAQAALPHSGNRTRRPHTAGKRSASMFGVSPVHQISSPPSSVPLAA